MGGNVIDLILWDLLDSAKDADESLQVFWPSLPWDFILFRTVANSCADSQHPLAHQKESSNPDLRLCSFQSQTPNFNFISSEESRTRCRQSSRFLPGEEKTWGLPGMRHREDSNTWVTFLTKTSNPWLGSQTNPCWGTFHKITGLHTSKMFVS